ncbi:MAG: hypothetical protein PHQ23_17305, partial [Candidatus Wallbacteria bacterium]|nr:hypothetical protein [Candidatus Wallbacteria bacterium]
WKLENGNLLIYAVKKNGPFQIDEIHLKLLPSCPAEDTFYTFDSGEFSIEEGIMTLSRWLAQPIFYYGQDLSELLDTARKHQIDLNYIFIGLDNFFLSVTGDFDTLNSSLHGEPLKSRILKIIATFQECVKKVRDSYLLVSQLACQETFFAQTHLPRISFKQTFLGELSRPIAGSAAPASPSALPGDTLREFLESPNFEGCWRVISLPKEKNAPVIAHLKSQVEKKKNHFILIAKTREELAELHALSSVQFPQESQPLIVTEPENYVCLKRLSVLIESRSYPEEIFFLINWFSRSSTRVFQFLPDAARIRFTHFHRVLDLVCAPDESCHENCEYSSVCEFAASRLQAKSAGIVLLTLPTFHQELIRPAILPTATALFSLNFHNFPLITLYRRSLSLLRFDSLLFYWHQLLRNSCDETVLVEGDREILLIKEKLAEVKRVTTSISNHYFLPEDNIDLDTLKLKFPFLFFSLFDALIPLFHSLKKISSFIGKLPEGSLFFSDIENLIRFLDEFLFRDGFRSVHLGRTTESTGFILLREISIQHVAPVFNNFIFLENHLAPALFKQLESICPNKRIRELTLPQTRPQSSEQPALIDWENLDLFSPEQKYLYRYRFNHFWPDYLKSYLTAHFSRQGFTPSTETLGFIIKKKLKYHVQISRDTLETLMDNLFYHTNCKNFYEFMESCLTMTDSKQPFTMREFFFLLPVCAIISRIEGKRVVLALDRFLSRLAGAALKWLCYYESSVMLSTDSHMDFQKSLEKIRDGIARIIIVEHPLLRHEELRSVLDKIKIDYRFSVGSTFDQFRVFSLAEADEVSFTKLSCRLSKDDKSITPLSGEASFVNLIESTLSPNVPFHESVTIKGLPFDTEELGLFLIPSSQTEIFCPAPLWEDFSKRMESGGYGYTFSKFLLLLRSNRGRDLVLSLPYLEKILENSSYWKTPEHMLDFLIKEGI